MALEVGVNSWATVAEADLMLADVVGTQAWFNLPDAAGPGEESKETFLVTAYHTISGRWPDTVGISGSDLLKGAQIILAEWLIGNREEYEKRQTLISSGVTSFSWSEWSESLGEQSLPQFVTDRVNKVTRSWSNQSVQLYGDDYLR